MEFNLTKAQKEIIRAAADFAKGEFTSRAQEFDRQETFDWDIRRKACDLGFLGINTEEAYSGSGMGLFEYCLVAEEFWAVDGGIAQAVLSTVFGADIIKLFGSAEQKEKYLPPLVTGETIMATAITEPDAGSDAAAAATTAIKDGGHWVVNGTKTFITNGTAADFILVFCRTHPENSGRHNRHSWIIVETDRKGFKAEKIKGKLGIRASDTAELFFSDVRVPESNLVGQPGNGFKELMAFFDLSRIVVAAHGVGIARAALEESIQYAKKRKQFGQRLADFQATQFKIAEMATRVKAARSLVYEAAWKADNEILDTALIAMAKWFAAKTAVICADEALQIHGGYGYIDEYKVQRIYRDAKILEIYEGTKEIEKMIIARRLLK
jgi:alkylation response protein AidB-like acyl-CoA dehydrogenase